MQGMTAAPSPAWLLERTWSLKLAETSGSLCPVRCLPGEAWGRKVDHFGPRGHLVQASPGAEVKESQSHRDRSRRELMSQY